VPWRGNLRWWNHGSSSGCTSGCPEILAQIRLE
jgi:hypothetical protein